MKSLLRTAVLSASVLWLAPVAAAQDLIGLSVFGASYKINPATGKATAIGSSIIVDEMTAMARRSDGLIVVGGGFPTATKLYTIDPLSGTGTLLLDLGTSEGFIRGLAFDGANTLHAVMSPGFSGMPPDWLYEINLVSGALTPIGSIGFNGVEALAWDNGAFFGWDVGFSGFGAGLITIDATTGAGTDVNDAVGGNSLQITALDISPTGELYGARTYLSKVNKATGVVTQIGPPDAFQDTGGIAFLAGAVGPTVYCTAKTSSCGSAPTIAGPSAMASLSAGSGSFDVTCGPVPGGASTSILFYSTGGPVLYPIQATLGFLCVTPGAQLFRVPGISLPVGAPCAAQYTYDFGNHLATQTLDPNLVAGTYVDMQAWYRDPANPGASNFSNAMWFGLLP
jgi:hypothetical protein